MGDLIPFRRRQRKWTRAEDYGAGDPGAKDWGKVLPSRRWRGEPPPKRGNWLGTMRPWFLLTVLIGLWTGLGVETLEPLPGLSSTPEQVTGQFIRCDAGRSGFCVVDGDTFRLGARRIRVLGIDAPETHPARCPAEAAKGDAATDVLLALLNRGPFTMTGRINDMADQYGRDLRALSRTRPDGIVQSFAADLIATGSVRRYLGGPRAGWC